MEDIEKKKTLSWYAANQWISDPITRRIHNVNIGYFYFVFASPTASVDVHLGQQECSISNRRLGPCGRTTRWPLHRWCGCRWRSPTWSARSKTTMPPIGWRKRTTQVCKRRRTNDNVLKKKSKYPVFAWFFSLFVF